MKGQPNSGRLSPSPLSSTRPDSIVFEPSRPSLSIQRTAHLLPDFGFARLRQHRTSHLSSRTRIVKASNAVSVLRTAITTLINVIVLHRQLNGLARNSHLSRHESGQIDSDLSGERMANGGGMSVLGTQVLEVAHQEHGYGDARHVSQVKWGQQ
jgi:hypothetical protein